MTRKLVCVLHPINSDTARHMPCIFAAPKIHQKFTVRVVMSREGFAMRFVRFVYNPQLLLRSSPPAAPSG